ncbi:alpha/beta hydrolase [Shewanella sp. C32]|uniref:Alpha/beta hydrolase n=1 Tax=Shewanella electrica TaxID=515560 RepID=A0ABT2FIV6_9GAMM|nr:alpha/beta hydrolase [Shewanella electrica]MCH1924018.1 alpha/beta hydrolase [Shewanella electrica]MCS4555921.1 alpha/beta hydrolase [Shewanella electrica]
MLRKWRVLLALTLWASFSSQAAEPAVYGAELEGFDYPWPVKQFQFESQRTQLHMAYMDVPAKQPNGHTVVMLHGKNFCAATWQDSITALTDAGYRVIAADQIGFCKSSKPEAYQYSFQQLAANTHALLASLNIDKAIVMGHSTGGMLGIRYALLYPEATEQLVLVNPIGLEDWKVKGVPFNDVDAWYQSELKKTDTGIRNYERNTYYAGEWRDDYEPWVQMLAGMYRGDGKEIVAWNSALLYDMIYTQPVYYEFEQLKVPTLLMIGEKDTTAIGKALAPEPIRKTLGNYPVLAREAAKRMPQSTLVLFPNYGHAPQMQAPKEFHQKLLAQLVGNKS